jgi:catechol 2,3-dioxygenase-like lactoylglutathione lyase family enzyme
MAYIRHIALRCNDVETSRRFYEQVIGLQFVGYRPNGVSVDLSDGTLNMTLLPYQGARPSLEEGEEYIHFGLIVDDLEAVWRRIRLWGSAATKTVKNRDPLEPAVLPDIAFKTLDPDGNIIDVSSNTQEWRGIRTP